MKASILKNKQPHRQTHEGRTANKGMIQMLKTTLAKTLAFTCLPFLLVLFPNTSDAQLARDVRDIFENIMDDLDEGLQAKFKAAIKNDTSTVEFTPAEFYRFRDNPINPFQGLNNISPDRHGGNIALKFELPSMRNRTVHSLERQSPVVLSQISQPVHSASVSTVTIFTEDRQVALGTVVQSDGYILTKASEVEKRKSLTCEFQDGTKLSAKLIRTDSVNDLAILKVEAKGLAKINWSDVKLKTGSFVLSPKTSGAVLALGTYSVAPRSTAAGEQAFLGVKPETTLKGVRVTDINPGSASFEAGLQNGDVITKLGGVAIPDVSALVKSIRDHRPGDTVEVEYLRNGNKGKKKAILEDRVVSGAQAAQFKMMNRLGAIPSRRDDNFPNVFQHDSPLFPEQCGGPVSDLDGNVIGINIARHGRAATYAIPANHVKTLLNDMLRSNVASR